MLATSTMTTIHPAVLEDVPTVVAMLQALRQETVWRDIDIEDEPSQFSIRLLYRLITDEDCCLYVAKVDGQVVGFCGGEIRYLYRLPSAKIVSEWGWYVLPEHRGGMVGGRLWNVVVEWGRSRGAVVADRVKRVGASQEQHTFVRL